MSSSDLREMNVGTFFHTSEEAMLCTMVKACLHSNIFLFFSNLKKFFLYMDINRMQNLHLHVERKCGKGWAILLWQ